MRLVPSPATTALPNTPLSEVIKKMKEFNLGSVLIVNNLSEAYLVGIFTERDLVKHFHRISKGQLWDKPIRLFMTKDVLTLNLPLLSKASDIMLKQNLRHIPIVRPVSRLKKRVLGILSMRDLFRMFHAHSEAPQTLMPGISIPKTKGFTAEIGVIEREKDIYALVSALYSTEKQVKVEYTLKAKKWKGEPIESLSLSNYQVIIVDLDDFEKNTWVKLLKSLNRNRDAPFTVLTYSPDQFTPFTINALKKVSRSRHFAIFNKPVDLMELYQRVTPFLRP